MKRKLAILFIFSFICINISAQNIDAQLSTDDSTSAFLIKNYSNINLLKIGGNGSLGIGAAILNHLFHVKGKKRQYGEPVLHDGNIILESCSYSSGETIYGAKLELNGGDLGANNGDINLQAGYDESLNNPEGGDININSGGTAGEYGEAGSINLTVPDVVGENSGGSINLNAGDGRGGGSINLIAGDGNSGYHWSGDIFIKAGDGTTYGNLAPGGDIKITAGNGDSDSDGGDIEITPGNNNGIVIINGSGTYSGTWSQVSDERLKKNIKPLDVDVENVVRLISVKYEMRTEEFAEMNLPAGEQIGLIAQEVEELFPALVETDNDGFKSVDYSKLSVLLLEAIKVQQIELKKMRQEINNLKSIQYSKK